MALCLEKEEEDESDSISDIIELFQSDFEDGTFRIQQSGTYKIMEDIVFDFNAGDLNDPNDGVGWWPRSDQVDEYEGAGTSRGMAFSRYFVEMAGF